MFYVIIKDKSYSLRIGHTFKDHDSGKLSGLPLARKNITSLEKIFDTLLVSSSDSVIYTA